MRPITSEKNLEESKGCEAIVLTPLSYILSDNYFYRRECSMGCVKLAIGDVDFESLKEVTVAYRHLYFV